MSQHETLPTHDPRTQECIVPHVWCPVVGTVGLTRDEVGSSHNPIPNRRGHTPTHLVGRLLPHNGERKEPVGLRTGENDTGRRIDLGTETPSRERRGSRSRPQKRTVLECPSLGHHSLGNPEPLSLRLPLSFFARRVSECDRKKGRSVNGGRDEIGVVVDSEGNSGDVRTMKGFFAREVPHGSGRTSSLTLGRGFTPSSRDSLTIEG